MIGGPADMLCSRARVDGYRAALETAGLTVDPELIHWGTFHVEAGFDHGTALLQLAERADRDLRRLGPAGLRRLRGGARAGRRDPGRS